jgi:hypothetical protein
MFSLHFFPLMTSLLSGFRRPCLLTSFLFSIHSQIPHCSPPPSLFYFMPSPLSFSLSLFLLQFHSQCWLSESVSRSELASSLLLSSLVEVTSSSCCILQSSASTNQIQLNLPPPSDRVANSWQSFLANSAENSATIKR